ncbi:hypothetical protein [Adhaeribacter terreus]|uniref:Uncharacterized protein n=1 Tax=Adhaeribacter terreus TaxID=529703 RepID=A0ABW0E6E4_9BACT
MITHNFRLIGNLLLVALILLIPVIAKFPWTSLDFIFAGVVLTVAVLTSELVLRKVTNKTYQFALLGCIGLFLLLIWAWAVA